MRDFEQFEDEFYRVQVESHERDAGLWIVRGSIIRKDTGETIGGTQARSRDVRQVHARLNADLHRIFATLPRPPHEWMMTSVRSIVMAYSRFNDELTSAYVALEHRCVMGGLSRDDLHEGYHRIRDLVRTQTIELIRKLEALSDFEKEQLVVSSEDVYQNILDPWNLDDAYARDAIFEYILRPSEELIRRNASHRARMIAEFARAEKDV